MLAKAAGMARCCALLSSTRVFSGFKCGVVVSNSGCKLGGVKPMVRLPGSALNKRKTCSFVTRASGDSGPFDSPLIASMQTKIKEQLVAESVTVKDENGDGRHVSISVVSAAFEGKSEVNRQRMVYKAIWEELQTTVHAVDKMTTKTPQEAAT